MAELSVDQIGLEQNFFDLGANSLMLVKIHRKVQGVIGRNFPIVSMFRHSTLASLLDYLGQDGTLSRKELAPEDRAAKQRKSRQARAR